MNKIVSELEVKIFADGADKQGMLEMASKPYIKGLTTNPTLMKKAGISNYKEFALDILQLFFVKLPRPTRNKEFLLVTIS